MLFGAKKRPKSTQKALFGALRARCPKTLKNCTPWGTFRPRPLSTPVNGGRDQKSKLASSNSIRIHIRQKIARNSRCIYSRAHGSFSGNNSDPGHLKPVILKPVGRMSVLGEFDLPGVVPGCFLGRPFCASKQGLQAPGSELLGLLARNPSDRKDWPKTGHADDWVFCDWV